ncbi:MAG: MarR family transcriptional regulator [Pseudomonadota bacterium]
MTKQLAIGNIFGFFNEIGIINQLASAEFQRALAPDLNPSEFGVLNHFVRVGDGRTPSELARIFQVTKPSMTAIIGKLEKKDLVTIVPSETDRRRKIIEITDAGRAARDAGIAATAPLMERLEVEFHVETLLNIQPVLEKLRIYLDERRNQVDGL